MTYNPKMSSSSGPFSLRLLHLQLLHSLLLILLKNSDPSHLYSALSSYTFLVATSRSSSSLSLIYVLEVATQPFLLPQFPVTSLPVLTLLSFFPSFNTLNLEQYLRSIQYMKGSVLGIWD